MGGKERLLLPWVGDAPMLTIHPIDDPIDENNDDLSPDQPDENSISSISGEFKLQLMHHKL